MRRLGAILVAIVASAAIAAAGAGADQTRTYRIEMLNAFGVFEGSDVRISGVRAGTVESVEVNEAKRAVATIELSGPLTVLGERTRCSTEPQSLIAEYFIDCRSRGRPLAEGSTIPAERVEQSIQLDLVLNTLREPYRERARLIVNELGTAMAANAEDLNRGIRSSVPALAELRGATAILARQRREIDRLNRDADIVVERLAGRRRDVARTVAEARDAATAAAGRRDDLARDADRLDDFLGELRPTLDELGSTARSARPLVGSLREAAPGLALLGDRLPPFNDSAGEAVETLGEAAVPARAALAEGAEEVRELRRASAKAPATAEILGDFLRDLDDPRRVVEIDARAARSCADPTRSCHATGRRGPTGYTGLEALLNYVYHQAGATNQFDSVGHLLQFNVFDVGAAPCGDFNAGPDVPAAGGGRTTDFDEVDPCVAWLGPNQPDVSFDLGLPPYDDSVCPDGSTHPEICDPAVSANARGNRGRGPAGAGERPAAAPGASEPPPSGGRPGTAPLPGADVAPLPEAGGSLDDLEGLLGLPEKLGGVERGMGGSGERRRATGERRRATGELLDFLFGAG